MSLFKPNFVKALCGDYPQAAAAPQRQPAATGVFKPGEVVWDEKGQQYHMAGPACVFFMLLEAYSPDNDLSATQHERNRASVQRGVRLATAAGFASGARLADVLTRKKKDVFALRALSDEMLQHVTAEQFLQHVFAQEGGAA